MSEKFKEIEINLSEEQLSKFSDVEGARKIINSFNFQIGEGNDFKNSLRNAKRENHDIDERTKHEVGKFLSSLNVDKKYGRKLNYDKALSEVIESQTKTGDEIIKNTRERIAEIMKSIPQKQFVQTDTKKEKKRFEPERAKVEEMENSEEKKINVTSLYLFPSTESGELKFGDKIITKIKIDFDENRELVKQVRDAVLIKGRAEVTKNALQKPHSYTIYYEENGIEKEYEVISKEITGKVDKILTDLNDKELGTMLYGVI